MTSTPSNTSTTEAAAAAIKLHDVANGHIYSSILRTVAVHRIADHLAESGGPLSVEELAKRSGTHAPFLLRILRLLATRGVFRQNDNGAFELTPMAELLVEGRPGSQRDLVLMCSDDLVVKPVATLEEVLPSGNPAFDTAYGAPLFEYLKSAPEAWQIFDRGMSAVSGPIDELVAQACPLPETGTVVDVGGGRGGLLRAVLRRAPQLTGVLLDQEQTVARHLLDEEETKGRWRVEGGDFFKAVPEGADLYLLKHVLHDWDDDECLAILKSIRKAIPAGGRLVAVDTVLVPGNDPHPSKTMDVLMLAGLSGWERSAEEFTELFKRADFKVTRIIEAPVFASLIEAEPV
ncbi:SAM-dependent methyltransferase [Streptomyces sp. NA04227]|uniref:methyltransferase n=1 Tax=Streptomyces sp. NA04227 TaxID=2742136 RepID=UPI00158FBFB1|nr:methyltransferase [Streptomyces sp. NA04227]QKW07564.1 SAM-dependent methyltransferase [Streptomyces sp. NA04227]